MGRFDLQGYDVRSVAEYNLRQYEGKQPSWAYVKEVLTRAKMSMHRFEITFGIVERTLIRYKNADRGLPVRYWHLFYEYDKLEKYYRNFKPKKIKSKHVKKVKISNNNQLILDAFRAKLQ